MSYGFLNILILGHSFVRPLRKDLKANFDFRATQNFHNSKLGYVTMLGTGNRTFEKVVKYDLLCVRTSKPDMGILELATTDPSDHTPEVVGPKFARLLRDEFRALQLIIVFCRYVNKM